MRPLWCVLLPLSACTSASALPETTDRDALTRDIAAYTMAKCLAFQEQPYLREQGERWADAVIQRGAGPIGAWTTIAQAVKAELAHGGVAQGRPERPTDAAISLPVLTCGEIGDAPSVRNVAARARGLLAPAYKARARAQ